MRFVLVGGGTGGHFYPLMAIAEALIDRASGEGRTTELLYMGPEPYDQESLDTLHIRFVYCPSGKLRRYRSILNILTPFTLTWGTAVAVIRLFWSYPDVIMSKGGYTSVPIVAAAWFLRIPIVIHESDTSVGRANKFAAKFAQYIGTAYQNAADLFPREKTALVGIPIRKALLAAPTGQPPQELTFEETLPVILVLGGSSGALRVNNLILEALDELLPSYGIIHQTGEGHLETVKETSKTLVRDDALLARYRPVGRLSAEMLNHAYNRASIVVSRAGSTTIFENAVHGMPAILIPIPEEISHDQRANAYAYARSGGAIVMEEGNLRDGLITAEITRILGNETTYRKMSDSARAFAPTDAAEKIASVLAGIAEEHGS